MVSDPKMPEAGMLEPCVLRNFCNFATWVLLEEPGTRVLVSSGAHEPERARFASLIDRVEADAPRTLPLGLNSTLPFASTGIMLFAYGSAP